MCVIILITITNKHLNTSDKTPHIGYAEYSQFLESTVRHSLSRMNPIIRYIIYINVDSFSELVIRIEEFDRGDFTNGGSSFQIDRLLGQYCPVVDYFNGTYLAKCPALRGTGCLELAITRKSLDFALYTSVAYPSEVAVYKTSVCATVPPSEDNVLRSRREQVVTWTSDYAHSATLTHHYGEPVHLITDEEMCRLIAHHYDHVTMMGSSHMRYVKLYLIRYD